MFCLRFEDLDCVVSHRRGETTQEIRDGFSVSFFKSFRDGCDHRTADFVRGAKKFFAILEALHELETNSTVSQCQDQIATRAHESVAHRKQVFVFIGCTELGFGEALKGFETARDFLFSSALGGEPSSEYEEGTRNLEDHSHHLGVRGLREFEKVPHDIEAGGFERADSGATRTDLRQAQLFDLPQGLAHGPTLDVELLGEFALRGEAVAGPVAAVQDVASQIACDALALGMAFVGPGASFV